MNSAMPMPVWGGDRVQLAMRRSCLDPHATSAVPRYSPKKVMNHKRNI